MAYDTYHEKPAEPPAGPLTRRAIDPVCIECGRSDGVVYVEISFGDMLCGKCYAASVRELAEWGLRPVKAKEKKKKADRSKWLELKTYVEPDDDPD